MAMSLALSDGLAEMRQLFGEYSHEPRVLDPVDARAFAGCAEQLLQLARQLENEVSRHRWNAAAREEREAADVLAELARPDTNVRLFPVIARPIGDGRRA